ncbi:MAG: 2-C-methyl-D-erythritol 4-phosphate cytidylyltransferase [Lachnospiraceae bacterium]|nr:2-C-methyl-D-erythritol 4-phosphate cytidylyltransferase [Lachnospiraceae bacterium]
MGIALILSGGSGVRLGTDIPKQYIEVCGRPVISHCIERLLSHPEIDGIQIVAAPQWHDTIIHSLEQLVSLGIAQETLSKFKGFSMPGENRQLSIYNGLTDIRVYADDDEIILIHDAARPMLSSQMITDCLRAVHEHEGVLPVLPMKDTVYQSTDGKRVGALLNRSEIYAGQAPEAFRLGKYYEANKRLMPNKILKINGSTEPAVMAGMDIVMIPGDEGNFKITTREDLERFKGIIKQNNKTEG